MADITPNEGQGLDIRSLASGTDMIGVFPSGNFIVTSSGTNVIGSVVISSAPVLGVSGAKLDALTGSFYNIEVIPTAAINNNATGSLIYAGALLGSIIKNIGGTEYAKVFSYSGASNSLVSIGSWTDL